MAKTKSASSAASRRGSPDQRVQRIDAQLVELLAARAEAVADMHRSGQLPPVADAQRQMEAFVDRVALGPALDRQRTQELMRQVVSTCLASLQHHRVTYLGPQYSYSHLAAVRYFGDSPDLIPVATIPAVFESIVRHESASGVVPIENSTDGRVVDTLGMFLKHRVRICGELLLPIHHNLLSRTPRAEITEIYSKPQALSQCREWLGRNLPAARLVEMSSTAAAAQLAAERHGAAAVASLQAGAAYGLEVIDANIEDNKHNVTRFAVLGHDRPGPTGDDKTALLFQVDHKPGALADVMNLIKRAKLNLTWIESFPLPGAPNEYLFFVEIEGHEQDDPVARTLGTLSKRTRRLEVLGAFPRMPREALEV